MKNYDILKEKMPELQLNIPLRCKFYNGKPNRRIFRPHWHDRLEILLVHEGGLNIEIDNEKYTINPGQAAVISPCRVHTATTFDNGAQYQMLMIDLSLLRNSTPAVKSFTEDLSATRISFKAHIDDSRIRELAKNIAAEYDSNPSPITVQGYIYLLLGILHRDYAAAASSVRFTASDKISAVTDYITEHFREAITTEKLSHMFGYAEAYFCRRFKQETKLTPMQYLKITRLEHSKNLLKLGARVSDAANQSGFSDPVYFTKCFKKQYGVTPGEYSVIKLNNARLEREP